MKPRRYVEKVRRYHRVSEGNWFAPKLYGFGATPVTWQGWLATGIFMAAILAGTVLPPDDLTRAAVLVPVILGFLALGWSRTEGGWRWRWGPDDD